MSTYANTYADKITGLGDIKYKDKAGQVRTVKADSGIKAVSPTWNVMTRRTSVPYDAASGGWGVRAMAENAGVRDIAWDGQRVTAGTAALTPSSVVNGTSYAPKKDIYSFINSAYAANGEPLVQANRYADKYGLKDLLEYNSATGEVTVDGVPIEYAYIDDDGNSWIKQSALDKAYSAAAARRGIKPGEDYASEYGAALDAAVREVDNWKYDKKALENDPVWLAYKAMCQREGAKAAADAMAQAAARTGGNLSSAAMAQAGAQRNDYTSKMNDIIPQLAEEAYNRKYTAKQLQTEAAGNRFNAGYGVNRDRIEDAMAQAAAQRQRMVDAESLKRTRLENEEYRKENEMNDFERAYNRGYVRGEFTPEEREKIGVGEDITPYAMKLAEYYNYEKPMTKDKLDMEYEDMKRTEDYKTALEQAIWREQAGIQQSNDLAKIGASAAADKGIAAFKNNLEEPESRAEKTIKEAVDNGFTVDDYIDLDTGKLDTDTVYIQALAYLAEIQKAKEKAAAGDAPTVMTEDQMKAAAKGILK